MGLARPAAITAPGPSGAKMVRSIRQIRANPLRFLTSVREQYGAVAQFPIPNPPTYLVCEPEAVRRVLVTNARSYGKNTRQYSTLSLVTGAGLLTADTEAWRPRRRLLQPAFHRAAVDLVACHVTATVERVSTQWRQQAAPAGGTAVIDVDQAMMHATLDVTGHALFGADLSADAERLAAATLDALAVVVKRARIPFSLPEWLPTPSNVALHRAVRELDRAVETMLAERRARPRQDDDVPRDMLDLLLEAAGLTPHQIRDEIVTFIVAGHETVASALTWAWHLLVNTPVVLQRMQVEIDEVTGGSPRPLGVSDFMRMPYTRAVVDETLRLYPPAWLITRRSLAADELAGYSIPADSLVIISPWLVHRDAEIWPEPEVFEPKRFLDAGGERATQRDGYLPFGAGPRQCIGREMALLESGLLLAGLVREFHVSKVGGQRIVPQPQVTVRPANGLLIRIEPRASC
jgi:cytochrome P450